MYLVEVLTKSGLSQPTIAYRTIYKFNNLTFLFLAFDRGCPDSTFLYGSSLVCLSLLVYALGWSHNNPARRFCALRCRSPGRGNISSHKNRFYLEILRREIVGGDLILTYRSINLSNEERKIAQRFVRFLSICETK